MFVFYQKYMVQKNKTKMIQCAIKLYLNGCPPSLLAGALKVQEEAECIR
jgi:hypothetical protein